MNIRNLEMSSARLFYRVLGAQDTSIMVRWRSTPEIYRYYRNPTPLTMQAHMMWLESYSSDTSRAEFILEHIDHGIPVGFIGAKLREPNDAELGCTIAEFKRTGLGTEAMHTLMKALSLHGVRRFWVEIHPENEASLGMFTKCGFKPYGRTSAGFYVLRKQL